MKKNWKSRIRSARAEGTLRLKSEEKSPLWAVVVATWDPSQVVVSKIVQIQMTRAEKKERAK